MLEKKLIAVLACPKCKGSVKYISTPREGLVCIACNLRYKIEGDIPVMLIDKANKT